MLANFAPMLYLERPALIERAAGPLCVSSASPEFLQKLTFLCYNHHSEVMKIDTVRAYTFGPRMVAEVDVVLPRDMPLHEVCGSVGMGWHCVCDL